MGPRRRVSVTTSFGVQSARETKTETVVCGGWYGIGEINLREVEGYFGPNLLGLECNQGWKMIIIMVICP